MALQTAQLYKEKKVFCNRNSSNLRNTYIRNLNKVFTNLFSSLCVIHFIFSSSFFFLRFCYNCVENTIIILCLLKKIFFCFFLLGAIFKTRFGRCEHGFGGCDGLDGLGGFNELGGFGGSADSADLTDSVDSANSPDFLDSYFNPHVDRLGYF